VTVAIKGTAEGLLVTLGEGEWDDVISTLSQRLASSASFFSGAEATLLIEGRTLDAVQLAKLRDVFSTHGGALHSVIAHDSGTRAAARGLGLSASAPRGRAPTTPPRTDGGDMVSGIVVRRTVRSGQSIRHAGHVIVIGDVNPGAELVAGADVVVWGRLRGLVHAGASGDATARVCALQLAPTQLRIADLITRPPEATPGGASRTIPEVARIREGNIVVEAWDAT
jgi:septum site-determining protein MinC